MTQDQFKEYLEEYYKTLTVRLDKGREYLASIVEKDDTTKQKGLKLFDDVMQETAQVENLMNFYNITKKY